MPLYDGARCGSGLGETLDNTFLLSLLGRLELLLEGAVTVALNDAALRLHKPAHGTVAHRTLETDQ